MKKILLTCLLLLSTAYLLELNAQASTSSNCSSKKVSDFPGAVWTIDGKMNDWQNLLGPETGDPIWPFGPTLGDNAYYEPYGNNDLDHPDPQSDLRVLSNIHDDYNVFFYFRLLNKTNQPNKIYYFLDINLNALLEKDEPVICVSFNSHTIIKVSLCEYIPFNQGSDLMSACGQISSSNFPSFVHTLPGTVKEVFNSANVNLLPNEIFSAAITEDGYGVELAVPWRFISQYKSFAYRVSLQKNARYEASKPMDNASCRQYVELINPPNPELVTIENTSVVTVIPGISYKIYVTLNNPTNVILNTFMTITVSSTPALPLTINTEYAQFPFNFPEYNGNYIGLQYLLPFSTKTFLFTLSFQGGSIQGANLSFKPFLQWDYDPGCQSSCCGKPINPIGFELGDESETRVGNNATLNNEESDFQNKVIVYPNPSKGITNIVIPSGMDVAEISVTDYTGKLIRKINTQGQRSVRIENLRTGFYLLNMRTRDGKKQIVRKVIVQ